jgi:hypothetical protein
VSTNDRLLTYDTMTLGRKFTPCTFLVDDDLLDAYARIVGQRPSDGPVGLLAVFARRAYLTEGVMPSGGVMASLTISCLSALPTHTPLVATAVVTDRQERKGRGWVTIDVTFSEGTRAFASARVLGVWPA